MTTAFNVPSAGLFCSTVKVKAPGARCGARGLSIAMQRSLQSDLDTVIAKRGWLEQSFLQEGGVLKSPEQKGGGMGFGGAGKTKGRNKDSILDDSKMLAAELRRTGVVRIDSVLSEACADALALCVDEERERANAEVAAGVDATSRFADLVLLGNRCDLLMPLRGAVIPALQELLGPPSRLAMTLELAAGKKCRLQEIACLISEPGSAPQPMHPDIPFTPVPPLFACFVALQDVSIEMGPTIYLPGTHNKEAHDSFYGGTESQEAGSKPGNEDFLRGQPVVRGMLRKGDCAVYNQQVLHCGSANTSDKIRRQFYVAVRNADTTVKGFPSIRPPFLNQMSLKEMQAELKALAKGKGGRLEEMNLADQAASGFSYE